MINVKLIKDIYPVHYLVWHNMFEELNKLLASKEVCIMLLFCYVAIG